MTSFILTLHLILKMKKLLLLITLTALISSLSAQDIVRIVHTNYITMFSKSLKYPVKVEWWDTKAKVSCSSKLPRSGKFTSDPSLPKFTNLDKDYTHSGYDRGHNSPASDNECNGPKILSECFYFSNMMPQPHISNAGDWEDVEKMTRTLASIQDSVHVWSGGVGVLKRIGQDSVAVPIKTWKVIYEVKQKTWMAFIFDNTFTKQTGVESHSVDKSEVEKLTGFTFN